MGGVRWNLDGRYESLEELPPTPIIRAGISIERDTSWHLYGRPKVDRSKCTKCRLCWLYCPEGAIKMTEEGPSFDYAHCKGCGICAEECPVKAIEMVVD